MDIEGVFDDAGLHVLDHIEERGALVEKGPLHPNITRLAFREHDPCSAGDTCFLPRTMPLEANPRDRDVPPVRGFPRIDDAMYV